MNREIRLRLKIIRDLVKENSYYIEKELNHIDDIMGPEEEPEPSIDEVEEEDLWTGPLKREGIYLNQLKELSELKDVSIIGQITNTFDLKSYIGIDKKTGEQYSGLIYRVVLTDPSDSITVIAFDDMAKELKKHSIGTHLRITNAWKMKDNKHGVSELHIGNFAKIEVVE